MQASRSVEFVPMLHARTEGAQIAFYVRGQCSHGETWSSFLPVDHDVTVKEFVSLVRQAEIPPCTGHGANVLES